MTTFYSPEPAARIEPAEFTAQMLSRRGIDAASLGLRQTVVVCFIPELARRLRKSLDNPPAQPHPIQRQPWYNPPTHAFSTITSPMGAPVAVMLLEQLIALGARRFLYLGFCGALNPAYHIGDWFIPTTAIREEGTSYHYLPAAIIPAASTQLNALLHHHATSTHPDAPVQMGPIWTTDALYRETAGKIRRFQADGVHAVDMEMSALFAVAQYRSCDVSALLIVSDECYHETWKPGFGQPHMRQACLQAIAFSIQAADQIAALP